MAYEELKTELKEAVILEKQLYNAWSKAIHATTHIPDGTRYGDMTKEDQELMINQATAHTAWATQFKASEKLRANLKRHYTITKKKLARMQAELETVEEEVRTMKDECTSYGGEFDTGKIEREFAKEEAGIY